MTLTVSADYRALGAAVIAMAYKDATSAVPRGASPYEFQERLSACEFLCFNNPDLEFWCQVAGMDMNAVQREARLKLYVRLGSLRMHRDIEARRRAEQPRLSGMS